MSQRVLFVDDDQHLLEGLVRVLRKEPYEVLTTNSATEAAQILEKSGVDVIVSDEHMPGMSGTEFLTRVGQAYPEVVRILLTGNPSLPLALQAINEGKVFQLLTKPCNEIDLAFTLRKALEHKTLMEKAQTIVDEKKQQSRLVDDASLIDRLNRLCGQNAVQAGRKGAPEGTGKQ